MVNISANNVDTIRRTARTTASSITVKTYIGVSYAQGIEIHNAEDPSSSTIPVRVQFNTDETGTITKFRTIRPGGSLSVDARIRNMRYISVGGTAIIEITMVW